MSNKNLKAENEQLAADLDAMTAYAAEADALIEFVTGELAIASFKGMIMEGLLAAAADYVRDNEAKKAEAAEIEARRAAAMKMPCIAKLALLDSFEVYVDGLTIYVKPSIYKRSQVATSEIGPDGEIVKTTTVLTGAAEFVVNLPMIGKVVMKGTLERTEEQYAYRGYIDVKNVAKFSMMVAGVERQVTIVATGDVSAKYGHGYEYGAEAQVTNCYCDWCDAYHNTEDFRAYITIG